MGLDIYIETIQNVSQIENVPLEVKVAVKVLVAGPGTIGASLALTCAMHGHPTVLLGRSESSLADAERLIARSADELVKAGLMPESGVGWRNRLTCTQALSSVPGDCGFALEAISEDPASKQQLLAELEQHFPPDTILASSTSGLPVDQIAAHCTRPEQVAVAHFANPPHLMPVVEVVPGTSTSAETIGALSAFVRGLGKTPVLLNRDTPGHLFNRIQFAMLREAMALVEQGIATPEQVDTVVKRGLALRLAEEGPLEKIDLAGLRLVHDVASYLYPCLDNGRSPELLKSMLDQGRCGAKTGQGFHAWNDQMIEQTLTRRNEEVIRHLRRLKKRD
jgi:3-hydroxybutyryl-CoA dehydrogenase